MIPFNKKEISAKAYKEFLVNLGKGYQDLVAREECYGDLVRMDELQKIVKNFNRYRIRAYKDERLDRTLRFHQGAHRVIHSDAKFYDFGGKLFRFSHVSIPDMDAYNERLSTIV